MSNKEKVMENIYNNPFAKQSEKATTYYGIPHDIQLQNKIYNGLRPSIPGNVPILIAELIIKCWDPHPGKRLNSKEIYDTINIWNNEIINNEFTELAAQIKKADEMLMNDLSMSSSSSFEKIHPEAIYFSRPLNTLNIFVDSVDHKLFETINPTTGKAITSVAEASEKDVDIAVEAATNAFNDVWCHVDGKERGKLINKLANLMERDLEELAALEALDNGKTFRSAKANDLPSAISCYRYFAGWCDKIHGKVIETQHDKFCYTRHEPFGVCGAIIPWNYPLEMQAWKMAPALACGNTIVLKSSELTPLTALKVAALCKEAGFPKGVVNVLSGFGPVAGAAIASHMGIDKISFTG
ncbi:6451_t:CDS:2 [Racocetra fulgida]|nr:6451_t:CDS:2 [Racocetra fulgida]